MTTLNGFFHVKLQPKLCILMMNPKHCEPAQTVWDHVGGPLLFILIAELGLGLSLAMKPKLSNEFSSLSNHNFPNADA